MKGVGKLYYCCSFSVSPCYFKIKVFLDMEVMVVIGSQN